MKLIRELFRRVAMLVRGSRFDTEIEEELEFHRGMETEANERNGMPCREAQAVAGRRVGNLLWLREESRDQWGWGWLDRLRGDAAYALRMLWRCPGYSAAVCATLAIAIGANSLVFSVADGLVFRPFPYPHPERLVFLWSEFNGNQRNYVSLPDFRDYRARNHVFESMGASIVTRYTIDAGDYSESITGRRATADFFRTLGVEPRFGRTFTPEDERSGSDYVIVLSDHCWRARFHADPGVIGRTVMLTRNSESKRTFVIVGVMPPEVEAAYPHRAAEVWTPISPETEDGRLRDSGGFEVIARLKPDISVAAAEAEARAIGVGLAAGHLRSKMTGAQLMPLQENLIGDTRQFMAILLGAVGFVLLLACANVANLALARASDREREMAIRGAIGAARGRLFRQALTEAIMLSLVGGAAGVAIAYGAVHWVRALLPPRVARPEAIAVDGRVLLFTFVVSVGAGILFGIIPAFRGSRVSLTAGLQIVRGGTRRHSALRQALVVAEVAIGFVLIVGAGLMVNSFVRLLHVDPGFARHDLLLVETGVSRKLFPSDHERAVVEEDLLATIRALPAVRYVGVSDFRPLDGWMNVTARTESGTAMRLPFTAEAVAGDYFSAMGTPLLRGRLFSRGDGPSSPPVIVINSAAASRYWPGEDPLGHSLVFAVGKEERVAEIIGVVGDVRRRSIDRPADPALYAPRSQEVFATRLDFVIRPEPDRAPASLARAVRTRMAEVDRSFSADSVTTMEAVIDEQLARPRFAATLLSLFGFLALAVTVTGVYGVTAYTVRARRHEIGVRIALGADRRQVLGFVLRRSAGAVALGLTLGCLGAASTTRLLTRLLYEVKPMDVPTFGVVVLLLAGFGTAASYVPALRAASVDPVESVRCD